MWFVVDKGHVTEALSFEQMRERARQRKLQRFDLVYPVKGNTWVLAIDEPRLFGLFEAASSSLGEQGAFDEEWVVSEEAEHRPFGPISTETLKHRLSCGELSWRDLVWRKGMSQWSVAVDRPELSSQVGLVNLPSSCFEAQIVWPGFSSEASCESIVMELIDKLNRTRGEVIDVVPEEADGINWADPSAHFSSS